MISHFFGGFSHLNKIEGFFSRIITVFDYIKQIKIQKYIKETNAYSICFFLKILSFFSFSKATEG